VLHNRRVGILHRVFALSSACAYGNIIEQIEGLGYAVSVYRVRCVQRLFSGKDRFA